MSDLDSQPAVSPQVLRKNKYSNAIKFTSIIILSIFSIADSWTDEYSYKVAKTALLVIMIIFQIIDLVANDIKETDYAIINHEPWFYKLFRSILNPGPRSNLENRTSSTLSGESTSIAGPSSGSGPRIASSEEEQRTIAENTNLFNQNVRDDNPTKLNKELMRLIDERAKDLAKWSNR